MSVSALAMIRKFAKTPVAAVFSGALDSSGNVTGLGGNSATGTLGTIAAGRNKKGRYTISAVGSSPSVNFFIYITGNVPEATFNSITVENGAGTPQTLLRSDAVFSGFLSGINQTVWTWGNGASRIWETSDDTETKKVIVL